jgi:hypothetical protein
VLPPDSGLSERTTYIADFQGDGQALLRSQTPPDLNLHGLDLGRGVTDRHSLILHLDNDIPAWFSQRHNEDGSEQALDHLFPEFNRGVGAMRDFAVWRWPAFCMANDGQRQTA